jgi:hypothetical protein
MSEGSGGGESAVGWLGASDPNSAHNLHHFHVRQHVAHIRTNCPVEIKAVHKDNDGNYTVDVQPLVHQTDGGGNTQEHGTVYGIPVHAATGKNGSHLIAPTVGDKGWIAIGDRDHSSVLASGKASPPGSRRQHSFSDSYYKGGFGSLNKPDNSITQDGDGVTHKTKKSHTFNADEDHTVNAKKTNINSPTEGVNIKGDLKPRDGSWNLGTAGNAWNGGTVQNAFSVISDQREKIVDAAPPLGLSFVLSLRPVSYRWADGGRRRHWGLLAQEVKASLDAAGVDFGGWVLADVADPESRQALRYEEFIAPLIRAVQELTARIEELEKQ